jgi:hypothetical protein
MGHFMKHWLVELVEDIEDVVRLHMSYVTYVFSCPFLCTADANQFMSSSSSDLRS